MKRIAATLAAIILISGVTVIRPNGDMEVWTTTRSGSGQTTIMGIGNRNSYLGTINTDRRGNINVNEYINTEYERQQRRNLLLDLLDDE